MLNGKVKGLSMNISMANSPLSVLTQHYGMGLKSTEEKIERFQKAQSQIDFFEGKKAELKNKQCASLDEIAQKLDCSIIIIIRSMRSGNSSITSR